MDHGYLNQVVNNIYLPRVPTIPSNPEHSYVVVHVPYIPPECIFTAIFVVVKFVFIDENSLT